MKHVCRCGKFKLATETSCGNCMPVAATTGHCKKHNKLYSTPDSSCSECDEEGWRLGVALGAAFTKTPELETTAKPARYNRGTIEVWDAIEKLQFNYMQGNVLKYVSRYQDKKGPEDLVKAINYIVKMISQETGIDYYELHKLSPEELGKRIKK